MPAKSIILKNAITEFQFLFLFNYTFIKNLNNFEKKFFGQIFIKCFDRLRL